MYKFAVNIALVTARRERWKSVSLDQLLDETDVTDWPIRDKSAAVDPDRPALQEEVWTALRHAIDHDLTDRQRQVLKAMVFDNVPMDEVVRHLRTNRNAVYKLLHDARRKLKARLEARGFGASRGRKAPAFARRPATIILTLPLEARSVRHPSKSEGCRFLF